MKKILLLFVILCSMGCGAQTALFGIIPIENLPMRIDKEDGAYLKDVNNLLNPYIGTWRYQNGNEILEIKLRKVIRQYRQTYSEDLLVGEYRYVDSNGIEQMNYLPVFNTIYPFEGNHNIQGNYIIHYNDRPLCADCSVAEKRVHLTICDGVKQNCGDIYLRKIAVNGQEAIQAIIRFNARREIFEVVNGQLTYSNELIGATIPNGYYTLIKQ